MPEPERTAAEQRVMEAENAENRVNDDVVAASSEVRPTTDTERPPTPADFDHGPDDDHVFHNEFTPEAVAEREGRLEGDESSEDAAQRGERLRNDESSEDAAERGERLEDVGSPDGGDRSGDGLYRSGVAHGEPYNLPDEDDGLWPAGLQEALTKRWQDVHLSFVDDPKSAVDQALSIVDDAVHTLTSRLAARRRELGELGEADTEELRQAVQRCHALFDELVH